MTKKGFTLIELLTVIAILSILAVISVPSVLKFYKNTKENTFITESQNVYKATVDRNMEDAIKGITNTTYNYY